MKHQQKYVKHFRKTSFLCGRPRTAPLGEGAHYRERPRAVNPLSKKGGAPSPSVHADPRKFALSDLQDDRHSDG